ncbi:MAG: hypothetical protein U5K27_12520 [Desulfotignum sp.]|nr:hypothetical protein [Desulfotignum sp.]
MGFVYPWLVSRLVVDLVGFAVKAYTLVDLVKAFKVLKSAEMGFEKDRIKITGLADYLIELERRSNQE